MSVNLHSIELSDSDYVKFKHLVFHEIGIELGDSKKSLVQTRLLKRLMHYKLDSYSAYLELVMYNAIERHEMMNLITTNETYFFREESHFHFLSELVDNYDKKERLRIWSAATSVGAEAYSIAMICDSHLKRNTWEVYGSDINSEVIQKASIGLYPEKWVDKIPLVLRKRYCLKGIGSHSGQFLIERNISKNIHFSVNNLMEVNNKIGQFHIIFLRNVLIYFDEATKKRVIENVMHNLKDDGYLIISLTESLQKLDIKNLKRINTSIYQKVK